MVEPKPNQPKRIVSWNEYWKGIQDLSVQLKHQDVIGIFIGIPRGGVVLNTLLTYYFDRTTQFLNWSLSDLEVLQYIIQPFTTFVLVDDIVDTGKTMLEWIDRLQRALPKEKNCQIKTVALYKRYNSSVQPDIFYHQVNDRSWLKFPYEEKE